jgi:hypothetical protein
MASFKNLIKEADCRKKLNFRYIDLVVFYVQPESVIIT